MGSGEFERRRSRKGDLRLDIVQRSGGIRSQSGGRERDVENDEEDGGDAGGGCGRNQRSTHRLWESTRAHVTAPPNPNPTEP
jgi:hypothetical protein